MKKLVSLFFFFFFFLADVCVGGREGWGRENFDICRKDQTFYPTIKKDFMLPSDIARKQGTTFQMI